MHINRDLIRALADRLNDTFGDDVLDSFETAIKQSLDAGDCQTACFAALIAGEWFVDHGRPTDALCWCKRAFLWVDRVEDPSLLPLAVAISLQAHIAAGRAASAKRLFSSATKRLRKAGRVDDEFYLTRTYAAAVHGRWGPERALYWSHRAARLALRRAGDESGRYAAITTHAGILNELGRHRHAIQLLMDAGSLLLQSGVDGQSLFFGFKAIATLYRDIGDPKVAMSLQLDALAYHNQLDERPTILASRLTAQAVVLSERGELAAALELLDQAQEHALRGGNLAQRLATLLSRQSVLAELGLFDRAISDCRAAVSIARKSKSPVWQLHHMNALGHRLVQSNRRIAFEQCLAAASQIVRNVTHPQHLALHAVLRLVPVENRGEPWALFVAMRRSAPIVLAAVSVGMYPHTIGTLMNDGYVGVFIEAITLIKHYLSPAHPVAWKYAIYFLDARQCIALREARQQQAMRMRIKLKPRARRWRPTRDERLFHSPPQDQHSSETRGPQLRGISKQSLTYDHVLQTIIDQSVFKFPNRIPRDSTAPPRPMTLADCREIIPDANTVLLLVASHESELLYIPIRLNSAGEPTILAPPQECCQRPNSVEAMRSWEMDCLDAQRHHADMAFREASHLAHGDLLRSHDWRPSFIELAAELDLDRLVRVIEPDSERRQQLHLVLVPDRYSCRIPIHAAVMNDQRRLYEHFSTCRYAESLSALRHLGRIHERRRVEERRDRVLRGVAFASPNIDFSERSNGWLEGVVREIDIIRKEFGDSAWWIHGNLPGSKNEATLRHFLERHNLGNVLVALGDGNVIETVVFNDGVKDTVCRMGTFRLADDFVTQLHLQRWPFDFRPVHFAFFSACVIGRLTGASGYEVDGFLASLAAAGCRRVLSALWELSDEAAPQFTNCLMKALKTCAFGTEERGPHSFAKAVRQAIDEFRRLDDHIYDHEFFWAPYVLYGLG